MAAGTVPKGGGALPCHAPGEIPYQCVCFAGADSRLQSACNPLAIRLQSGCNPVVCLIWGCRPFRVLGATLAHIRVQSDKAKAAGSMSHGMPEPTKWIDQAVQ